MPYFETSDGVQLLYQDWGAGEPVVFVSAWALSSRMWQYQMINLIEHGLRCVAYDRRGHGRSDQPGHGYDYDTLADDLARLIDTLGLTGVTLVGHSMGGGEIVRYLTRHGDGRVARVALVAPLGPFPLRTEDNPHGFDPAVVAAMRAGWRRDFPAWMDASADGYVGKGLPGCNVSDGLVEWTRQDMLRPSLLALIECNRTGVETDLRLEMTKIRLPTLIIQGEHDRSIPTELSGKVCARLIAGSIFKLYENAPHGLYLTHPDRLTQDLLTFINGADRAPTAWATADRESHAR
jgi:pimeloyl-ACP methyl ester carboxylesterase